jgi:hypothetical protein
LAGLDDDGHLIGTGHNGICICIELVTGHGIAMMGVLRRRSTYLGAGRSATVVIRAAERHGRGGGPLRRHCQHQQPNQKHSDKPTHLNSLLHAFFATQARLA